MFLLGGKRTKVSEIKIETDTTFVAKTKKVSETRQTKGALKILTGVMESATTPELPGGERTQLDAGQAAALALGAMQSRESGKVLQYTREYTQQVVTATAKKSDNSGDVIMFEGDVSEFEGLRIGDVITFGKDGKNFNYSSKIEHGDGAAIQIAYTEAAGEIPVTP